MLYTYLWYFLIYSFIGWCCEVAFAAIIHGRFVNRGFLNGAVCPIYGFGVCIVYAFLMPFKDTWVELFFLSMLLTTLLELVTGFLLDKIFHQRWWDYTENAFNLGGYICLIASLGWGIGCLFVVKVLFPLTDLLIGIIPKTLGVILLCVFMLLFVVDTAVTFSMMIGLNKYMKKLDGLAKALHEDSSIIGKKVSDGALGAKAKYQEITAEGTPVSELVNKGKAVRKELDTFGDTVSTRTKEIKQELSEKGKEFKEELSEKGKELKTELAQKKLSSLSLKEKNKDYEEMLSKITKKYSRLFKAFPNFKFKDFPEQTNALKDWLKSKKKEK